MLSLRASERLDDSAPRDRRSSVHSHKGGAGVCRSQAAARGDRTSSKARPKRPPGPRRLNWMAI